MIFNTTTDQTSLLANVLRSEHEMIFDLPHDRWVGQCGHKGGETWYPCTRPKGHNNDHAALTGTSPRTLIEVWDSTVECARCGQDGPVASYGSHMRFCQRRDV